MFWADAIAGRVEETFGKRKGTAPLLIRDEKTASGRVHVGSMRGVAVHGVLSEILAERGVPAEFRYEINDFDPMDGLPVYLDRETFLPHMGKPLCRVPSPDGKAANYAEYFAEEFMGVIRGAGFDPTFYRASELYFSGEMNGAIRTALESADAIRRIYREVSGSTKDDTWLPLSVVCPSCGKIGTVRAFDFNGETVGYRCEPRAVEWAEGCGGEGRVSPFDGGAKLPWKVEWAAKFAVLGVDIEGGGKDHSTKGGARDVANHICREVFKREPPFDVPYEFFLVGGKKMSSSKGAGSSAREIADLLPPELFRFALLSKDLMQAINFDPEGDTIPVLYDAYDRAAEKYFSGAGDDFARLFSLSQMPASRKDITSRFLPRFSQVAFIVQMPHLDLVAEVERLKGEALTSIDRTELETRARYARAWLSRHAPEAYRFEIKTDALPEAARAFSKIQKVALKRMADFMGAHPGASGQVLHGALHALKGELGIAPKDLFSALYISILGKESGPKAGWFLSVLDHDFAVRRLSEAGS